MLQALTLSKSQIDYKQPERNIHDRIYRTSLLVVSGIPRGLIICRINSKVPLSTLICSLSLVSLLENLSDIESLNGYDDESNS